MPLVSVNRHALVFCVPAILLIGLMSHPVLGQKVLAPGFKVELFFGVPEVEHPSVVTCDDAGNLFIGEDPMDMRGPTTKEFDRVLFVRWNEDGTAERTVFCENLSAVFGLAWLDGWLYVMHAPHYSRFADTDGDGKADVREDLAEGFGPAAGIFGFNDHIVTGIRLGMDGWMYVSVGDKGIQRATGKDGSAITLEGGGVVRLRPDGTRLEVYSSGTRNHLDVAMNSLDEIFTYDNTDDGLGWWTRFTHHMQTGYYGYPFDYLTRPERHLPRISEHGGGSPCGAACYREAVWPTAYRDAPFFAEWGKGKVQCFHVTRSGGTYTGEIEDFMVPEENSTFRPVDLCFSPDGRHMYVADWNFGGWTNPTVCGRVYRVTYVGEGEPSIAANTVSTTKDDPATWVADLSSESFATRWSAQQKLARQQASLGALRALLDDLNATGAAKIHALWALAAAKDLHGNEEVVAAIRPRLDDSHGDVRAQAVRALGELNAQEEASAIAAHLRDAEPRVRAQAAIALGRLDAKSAVSALTESLDDQDTFARFAKLQAVRRLNDWAQVADVLRQTESNDVRHWGTLAASEQYEPGAVALLADRLQHSASPQERRTCVDALADVYFQAAPYQEGWWGTRPAAQAPPRPKKHDWVGGPTVFAALASSLDDTDAGVRAAVVRAFQMVPAASVLAELRQVAEGDPSKDVRKVAFATLAKAGDAESLSLFLQAAENADSTGDVRAEAVRAVVTLGGAGQAEKVRALLANLSASSTASDEVVSLALDGLASLASPETVAIVEERTRCERPPVRAKALAVLAQLQKEGAAARLEEALGDDAVVVRQTAARQLGELGIRTAVAALVKLTSDAETRFDAVLALAKIADPCALDVYLDALIDRSREVRTEARKTLVSLRDEVADAILAKAQRGELTRRARGELAEIYTLPRPITAWHLVGPWSKETGQPAFDPASAADLGGELQIGDQKVAWKPAVADASSGKVDVAATLGGHGSAWSLGYAEWESARGGKHTFQVGSDDQLLVWIDGQKVFEFNGERGWSPAQQSFDVELEAGVHRIWALCGNGGAQWEFSMHVPLREERFDVLATADSSKPDIGPYIEHAMQHEGSAERGKALFQDVKGLACVKCHAVGGDAKAVLAGPDLAGIGGKYDRREIIRSVLEPSNRLLSGYEMTVVATSAGEVLQGVVKSDTAERLELVDVNGKVLTIATDDIEERMRSELSLMPTGLYEGISVEEFADLMAYLRSLKEVAPADEMP
ncbi:MAG: HEAT repeat domain-containing protein [Pirellulales bacterium]|nr:HEAT repeat domain-containing protein [Pirellulales bacterium]